MSDIFLSIDFYYPESVLLVIKFSKVIIYLGLGGLTLYWIFLQYNKVVNRKLETKYTSIFRQLINKHIYSNKQLYLKDTDHIDLPLNEFRVHSIHLKSIRKVLVKIILESLPQFPGEKNKLLKRLYKDLDLELYTLVEINTLKGDALVLAINELAAIGVAVEEFQDNHFLRHKDLAVRNAIEAYIQKVLSVNNLNTEEDAMILEDVF